MTPKEIALGVISRLPDTCSHEDIHYHLYVREKIEQGLQAVEQVDVVTQEDAEKEAAAWLRT